MTPSSKREFDIVLLGATGFTGRLVAEYLAKRCGFGGDVRWAIAGRSRAKLEEVRSSLVASEATAALPLLVADVGDRAALDEIADKTRVICTTVGPYALYGKNVVAACVEKGTSYCDLTGETPFIREMIDLHHERAKETGARIVHCCGFDSVPFDLGVLMVQDAMKARHGVRCARVKTFAGEQSGGVSGGTIASAMNLMDEAAHNPSLRKIMADPYALVPGERGPDGSDQRTVRFDGDLKRWTAPFVMAAVNTRVVRRSNALLGYPWGRDFRYSEAMSMTAGPAGWARAVGLTAGLGAFFGLASVTPLRKILRRALPSPGEGPSKKARDQGFFKVRVLGMADALEGARGPKLLGLVAGTSDPGYGETAKMLGESAMCLAKDEPSSGGGVLTPASSMGSRLVERLRAAGMTWDVLPFGE